MLQTKSKTVFLVSVFIHLILDVNLVSSFSAISSSCTSNFRKNNFSLAQLNQNLKNDDERSQSEMGMKSRREMIILALTTCCTSKASAAEDLKTGETLVYETKSGLKYIELKEGTGKKPLYGELVTFSYKAYIKVAGKNRKPELFDQASTYLTKHGNGRLIPGLDEGLHTMKVGGKRRLIIPPKLGYVAIGLGPLPSGFLARGKLNSLIDQMIEVQGGQVIFEIEMLGIVEDEADQGYYFDKSLTPEQFNTLRTNMQKGAAEAKRAQ